MAVDLLGLQSQKKYREAQGKVVEDLLRGLLKNSPRALPSNAVRALLRGMPAARVAKLIEILIDHLNQHPGPVESGEEFFGWQHEQHCKGPLPPNFIRYVGNNLGGNASSPPYIYNACLSGQLVNIGYDTDWSTFVTTMPSSAIGIQKHARYGNPGDPEFLQNNQCRDRWIRKVGGSPVIYQPAESYQTHPAEEYPVSLPDWAPSIPEFAPFWLPSPPGGPSAAPKRLRKTSPFFETGPDIATSPLGLPGPNGHPTRAPGRGPHVSPKPGTSPGTGPGSSTGHPPVTIDDLHAENTQVQVDGDGNTSRPRSTHHFAPPPRGVKEKKVALGGTGKLGRFYGSLSEGKELIDDIWGALPDDVKGKRRKTPQQKLTDLWQHWDRLDAAKAIGNVIWDKSVDRIIGAAASAGRKAWRDHAPPGLRASRGPTLGMRYTQHVLGRSHF